MRTRSPPAPTQPQLGAQRSCRIPRLPHNPTLFPPPRPAQRPLPPAGGAVSKAPPERGLRGGERAVLCNAARKAGICQDIALSPELLYLEGKGRLHTPGEAARSGVASLFSSFPTCKEHQEKINKRTITQDCFIRKGSLFCRKQTSQHGGKSTGSLSPAERPTVHGQGSAVQNGPSPHTDSPWAVQWCAWPLCKEGAAAAPHALWQKKEKKWRNKVQVLLMRCSGLTGERRASPLTGHWATEEVMVWCATTERGNRCSEVRN